MSALASLRTVKHCHSPSQRMTQKRLAPNRHERTARSEVNSSEPEPHSALFIRERRAKRTYNLVHTLLACPSADTLCIRRASARCTCSDSNENCEISKNAGKETSSLRAHVVVREARDALRLSPRRVAVERLFRCCCGRMVVNCCRAADATQLLDGATRGTRCFSLRLLSLPWKRTEVARGAQTNKLD